ncbi:MAG: T9SS type A sorting domain-containing protein [Ignavibacteriota bacterium]
MTKKLAGIFILFFAICGHVTIASAQFNWQVDHVWNDGQYYYSFDAISSYGNVVTAGGNIYDTVNKTTIHMLSHTTNAGVYWDFQDPGLPHKTYSPLKEVPKFRDIQQIDSLNAVAVGDSDVGPILRTTDGGHTWVRQSCADERSVWEVHFSSPRVGIVLAYHPNPSLSWHIYTTFDGGNTWQLAPFRSENVASPHSYGDEGGFSIFKGPHGPIYSTKNNWVTVDSTTRFFNDSTKYLFWGCNYFQDSVIAYGEVNDASGKYLKTGIFLRSFDRGQTWKEPVFLDGIKEIRYMTPIDRDTIIAAGWDRAPGFGNNIAISTDRGATWRTDTIILTPPFNGACNRAKGITFTSNGTTIAEFGNTWNVTLGIDSTLLIRALPPKRKVEWSGKIYYNHRLFPIPATRKLNIASVEDEMPFSMIDVLGRIVLEGQTLSHESKEIDVGDLPRGVYYVLVDYGGVRGKVVVGKAILVGQ